MPVRDRDVPETACLRLHRSRVRRFARERPEPARRLRKAWFQSYLTTMLQRDVRGLQAMANAVGKRWLRGVVLYTGTQVIPFAGNLHGLPLALLWAKHR